MGQNLATYLLQSEQIRSAVGIEAAFNKEDPSKLDYAAGFYIEAFPDLEDKDINLIEVIIQNLPKFCDMNTPEGFDLDELLDQLRGPYEIDIVKEIDPKAYCPCSRERTVATLATLPLKDLQDLEKEGKDLEVICDFCRTPYQITIADLREIIKDRKK